MLFFEPFSGIASSESPTFAVCPWSSTNWTLIKGFFLVFGSCSWASMVFFCSSSSSSILDYFSNFLLWTFILPSTLHSLINGLTETSKTLSEFNFFFEMFPHFILWVKHGGSFYFFFEVPYYLSSFSSVTHDFY